MSTSRVRGPGWGNIFIQNTSMKKVNKPRTMYFSTHFFVSRSICSAVKYFSLFLPTSRGIPPDKSWKIWLPELNMFWSTWGNSPNWEVDILKLYARLAVHQVQTIYTLHILNLHVKQVIHVRGDWDRLDGR